MKRFDIADSGATIIVVLLITFLTALLIVGIFGLTVLAYKIALWGIM